MTRIEFLALEPIAQLQHIAGLLDAATDELRDLKLSDVAHDVRNARSAVSDAITGLVHCDFDSACDARLAKVERAADRHYDEAVGK